MKRDALPGTTAAAEQQAISRDVLAEKYFKPGETSLEQLYGRVARALASVEKPELRAEWEQKFLANLYAGAIGAGRIMRRLAGHHGCRRAASHQPRRAGGKVLQTR